MWQKLYYIVIRCGEQPKCQVISVSNRKWIEGVPRVFTGCVWLFFWVYVCVCLYETLCKVTADRAVEVIAGTGCDNTSRVGTLFNRRRVRGKHLLLEGRWRPNSLSAGPVVRCCNFYEQVPQCPLWWRMWGYFWLWAQCWVYTKQKTPVWNWIADTCHANRQ